MFSKRILGLSIIGVLLAAVVWAADNTTIVGSGVWLSGCTDGVALVKNTTSGITCASNPPGTVIQDSNESGVVINATNRYSIPVYFNSNGLHIAAFDGLKYKKVVSAGGSGIQFLEGSNNGTDTFTLVAPASVNPTTTATFSPPSTSTAKIPNISLGLGGIVYGAVIVDTTLETGTQLCNAHGLSCVPLSVTSYAAPTDNTSVGTVTAFACGTDAGASGAIIHAVCQ